MNADSMVLTSFFITDRGFITGHFNDCLGEDCSIQESSCAEEERIWLGVHTPKVQVMSIDKPKVGAIVFHPNEGSTETSGWQVADLPDFVHVFGRMELNRDQCRVLGKILTKFAKTGELDLDQISEQKKEESDAQNE